jgi:hypothetical protein
MTGGIEVAIDRISEQRQFMNLHPKVRRGFLDQKENLTVKDGVITNHNGTDVSHIFEVVMKQSAEQAEGFRIKKELRNHEEENGGFVFAFFNACTTMADQFPALTQSDLARVMFIGTYSAWGTGQLKHDNGIPINKKTLGELLAMSRNKFNEFYKSIVDCEIIAEQDGAIFMNPTIFYRGSMDDVKHLTNDMQHTRLFRKTVRDLYAMYNGRTIKQLALIYSVLPFVNFAYNIIAYNPDEMNPELVRPITLDKLAALLGYQSSDKLVVALRKLKYEGKSVFGFFETDGDKRSKKTVINPRVVFAGNGKSLDAIRILFK